MTEYMSRKSKDNVFEVINYMKLFSLLWGKSNNADSHAVFNNFVNLDLESGNNSNNNSNNNNTANINGAPQSPKSPPPESKTYIEKKLDNIGSSPNKIPDDFLKDSDALDAYHTSVLTSLDAHSAFLAKLSLGQFVNKSETEKFKKQLSNLNYDNSKAFWNISSEAINNNNNNNGAGAAENAEDTNNETVDEKELESFLTFESFRAKKTYDAERNAEKSMKLGTVYLILTSKFYLLIFICKYFLTLILFLFVNF